MKIFKSFFKQFSFLAIIVLLLSILIDFFIPKIKISPMYPYILIFLYLVTLAIFKMVAKSMENRLSRFANTYMLAIFGKLILFTGIILLYSFLIRDDAISFMLTFFTYYFIFTVFEVLSLLRVKQ